MRPDTALAKQAGLEIGERGGIRTDEQMRTSEPDIFAAGDTVEVRDFVTGEWSLVALAGPANRQGRIIADVIAGRDSRFRGTQETDEGVILDVREPFELAVEDVEGAVNIPLGELRARLDELPREKMIHVICRSGQRAYYATRLLLQHGFDARNAAGGHAVENVFVVLLAGGTN